MKSWPAKALLLAGARRAARRHSGARPGRRPNRCCRRASAIRKACRRRRRRGRRRRAPQPGAPARAGGPPADGRPRSQSSRRRRGGRARRGGARPAGQLFHRFPRARTARPIWLGVLTPGQFGPRPRRVRRRPRRLLGVADGRARRAAAVALDLDPASPRLAVAALGAGRRSARSTGSPSAPGCCFAWARRMRRGCWSRRSTSSATRRAWSRSRCRPRSPPPIRPACALWSRPAGRWSDEPVWTLADAMCAALEGDAARASQLIEQARNRAGAGIDLLLAEKVVGAGRPNPPRGRHRVGGSRSIEQLALRPRQRHRGRDSRPADEPRRAAAPGLAGAGADAAARAAAAARPRSRRRSAFSRPSRWSRCTA